jgi:hypothetical protein
MIFDGTRDLFEVARSFVHFFAHESCGFCTPVQGRHRAAQGLHGQAGRRSRRQGRPGNDIDWLDRLLKNASHCGLGSAAPNPVIDTLQKFRPAYERRLVSLDFEPAFDLDAALAEARQLTARDDPGAHLQTHEEGTSVSKQFLLDGQPVPFEEGQSILEASRKAGHYIPSLCWHKDFPAPRQLQAVRRQGRRPSRIGLRHAGQGRLGSGK